MVSLARRRRRLDLVSIDSGSSGTDLARLVGSSAAASVCASVHPCAVARRLTLMPPGYKDFTTHFPNGLEIMRVSVKTKSRRKANGRYNG